MATAVEAGAPIAANQLRSLAWPGVTAPEGSFTDPAAVVGRVARQALVAGEPVFETRLAPVDSKGGLSATLPPGKRAITVRVNDVIGVAGFALPGSFVDVLLSAKDSRDQPFSRIVLNRVKVLAVAQETAGDPSKPKVVNAVTLELSPEESEQLDLARSVGSLSLVLRNELDATKQTASVGARLDDLVGTRSRQPASAPSAAPARAPAAPAAPVVQEYRGTRVGAPESK